MSRDRLGIKPLYYSHTGSNFSFASEIKALKIIEPKQEISLPAVNYYFYHKYIGKEHSIYTGIKKILPGYNLTYALNTNRTSINKYYEPSINNYSTDVSIAGVEQLIKDAVNERLLADVEVGCFLSGGVDSSLISALVKKEKSHLRTFSIGFKEASYSELEFSDIVAKHIDSEHITEVLSVDDDFIEESMKFVDEPFGDASYIPTRLLSKLTSKHVKVALSGDGADEVFGGYDTYFAHWLTRFYPSFVHPILKPLVNALPEPNTKVSKVLLAKRFFRTYSNNAVERHRDWMATFPNKERSCLLAGSYVPANTLGFAPVGISNIQQVQLEDIQNYMVEDILKKVDLASMSNGLEVRVPFISPKIIHTGLNLPTAQKLNFRDRKIKLKQVARQHIPASILERKKRGFTSPLRTWFAESALLKEYILSENYYTHGFFRREDVHTFYTQNSANRDFGRELWLCFAFNFWYKHHFCSTK